MRIFLPVILIFPLFLWGQGTPPMVPDQPQPTASSLTGTPPIPRPGAVAQVEKLVVKGLNNAISGKHYLALNEWQPLTPEQKVHIFLAYTYSPRTFASAGVDAVKDKIEGGDRKFASGATGLAQHYGVELATSESDVFFERFLFPSCSSRTRATSVILICHFSAVRCIP